MALSNEPWAAFFFCLGAQMALTRDFVGLWLAGGHDKELGLPDGVDEVPAGDFRSAFQVWAQEKGHACPFSCRELGISGVEKKKKNGKWIYIRGTPQDTIESHSPQLPEKRSRTCRLRTSAAPGVPPTAHSAARGITSGDESTSPGEEDTDSQSDDDSPAHRRRRRIGHTRRRRRDTHRGLEPPPPSPTATARPADEAPGPAAIVDIPSPVEDHSGYDPPASSPAPTTTTTTTRPPKGPAGDPTPAQPGGGYPPGPQLKTILRRLIPRLTAKHRAALAEMSCAAEQQQPPPGGGGGDGGRQATGQQAGELEVTAEAEAAGQQREMGRAPLTNRDAVLLGLDLGLRIPIAACGHVASWSTALSLLGSDTFLAPPNPASPATQHQTPAATRLLTGLVRDAVARLATNSGQPVVPDQKPPMTGGISARAEVCYPTATPDPGLGSGYITRQAGGDPGVGAGYVTPGGGYPRQAGGDPGVGAGYGTPGGGYGAGYTGDGVVAMTGATIPAPPPSPNSPPHYPAARGCQGTPATGGLLGISSWGGGEGGMVEASPQAGQMMLPARSPADAWLAASPGMGPYRLSPEWSPARPGTPSAALLRQAQDGPGSGMLAGQTGDAWLGGLSPTRSPGLRV
ncbi:hypothetical protein PAPYR_12059 [Paratrimastix pyriformis]|uniref:Uncharacterized protein n=1 Tax=Paratrimastix pyriformis TaxID=342808 RepID=A0ABQ8U9G8_9EUKA|nr:hypothetical protein PAPYR_12059 [Paratrimastix pyriformis]